jgi:acetyl/propionyl-CoA carboxylase alpha subunit/acetyl-CoA carboxylase carboxyltransferase component
MSLTSLLVANRGEIAIRILRSAAEMGMHTVAVYSEDDAESLHIRKADEARMLTGRGAMAYLDIDQLIAVAKDAGCDSIHPGYGFLAENANFARRCAEAGITFVGPSPDSLELFGDKGQARTLAEGLGVPVMAGTEGATTLEQTHEFFTSLNGNPMLIKAVGGGGGRGMRVVESAEEVDESYARCQSEAQQAFGIGDVYVEQLMLRARHIEVQIAGDADGNVIHLGERECSIQRRHQKVVEIAPSPTLLPALRDQLTADAVRLAEKAGYHSVGTFEFLGDASAEDPTNYAFIESNARLQVEHTVTEEVTGVDIVKLQLELAAGRSLPDLGLTQDEVPSPRGYAIQARINMETMLPDGTTRPAGGLITTFEAPSGPGIRTDSFGYAGYRTSVSFDSLLAKLIGHSASNDFADAVTRTYRALCEFRIEGVATNIPFLQTLLQHPDFIANNVYTRFVDDHIAELAAAEGTQHQRLFFEQAKPEAEGAGDLAGVKVDATDPLSVIAHGRWPAPARARAAAAAAGMRFVGAPSGSESESTDGTIDVPAPMQGTLVSIDVEEGELVRRGQQLFVMEAMKMEHVIEASTAGVVRGITVAVGDAVFKGHILTLIDASDVDLAADDAGEAENLDEVRQDVAEVIGRHDITLDAARPDAVEKRRRWDQRTARENIDDICDPGTFVEWGQLVLTSGTGLPLQEVIEKYPTDGMITGIGTVNGDLFDGEIARCAVLSYDYTVLAGTQGGGNHRKTDRMLEQAEKTLRPVVFIAEGGGGRAGTGGNRRGGSSVQTGDIVGGGGGGLDTPTFATMSRLSGLVPLVGITSGRCYAGNAAVLGVCDVIIATANSNIGMGGPAMIEGGGLGVFTPEEVGPMDVQVPNGVVDIPVADEAEAVQVGKKYLSYFQGPLKEWESADQRRLRNIVPENRLRVYDMRDVIETFADTDSVLEIRRFFGPGMITSLVRVDGRPLGVIANNPMHLGGAIDSDGSDKAARFMQLCDAFDIPILVLCDTPGMMVGPEVEKTALVRHCSRVFVIGANITVPLFTIVLRKAYGLGAMAMAGGSFKQPLFTVAWPTAEFGGMGLEGQVKLGFRQELAEIEDVDERTRRYEELVDRAYQRGGALNAGVSFAVDDVIDPADTRRWVGNAMRSVPEPQRLRTKKRRNIDTW